MIHHNFPCCFFRHENQVGPNLENYHRIHVHLPTFWGRTKTPKIQIYPMYQPYITVPPWASSHPPNIDGFLFTWTMTVTCEKPRFLFKKKNLGFLTQRGCLNQSCYLSKKEMMNIKMDSGTWQIYLLFISKWIDHQWSTSGTHHARNPMATSWHRMTHVGSWQCFFSQI